MGTGFNEPGFSFEGMLILLFSRINHIPCVNQRDCIQKRKNPAVRTNDSMCEKRGLHPNSMKTACADQNITIYFQFSLSIFPGARKNTNLDAL